MYTCSIIVQEVVAFHNTLYFTIYAPHSQHLLLEKVFHILEGILALFRQLHVSNVTINRSTTKSTVDQ